MRQHEERLALACLAGGLLGLAIVVLDVLGAPVLGWILLGLVLAGALSEVVRTLTTG